MLQLDPDCKEDNLQVQVTWPGRAACPPQPPVLVPPAAARVRTRDHARVAHLQRQRQRSLLELQHDGRGPWPRPARRPRALLARHGARARVAGSWDPDVQDTCDLPQPPGLRRARHARGLGLAPAAACSQPAVILLWFVKLSQRLSKVGLSIAWDVLVNNDEKCKKFKIFIILKRNSVQQYTLKCCFGFSIQNSSNIHLLALGLRRILKL